MKRLKPALTTMVLLPLLAATTLADPAQDYERLFIFGDSLSDPGNRFAVTGQTAHPPFVPVPDSAYGVGGHHFSNGSTWVEVMSQHMGLTEDAKPAYRDPAFGNFAYGGARARAYSPTAPSFGQQVQAWIGIHGCSGEAMDDTLFVVQFGGNDLRDVLEAPGNGLDPMTIIPDAIQAMVSNIGILQYCGARHFLVANVPDLGATPLVPVGAKPLVTAIAAQFNAGLEGALSYYLPALNRSTLDLFGFIGNASGFAETSLPCLSFGVTMNAFCKDRDNYLFWDAVHPTKKAHALLGEDAIGQLPARD